MRTLGSLFISVGIMLMSYALLYMDTSVPVNYPNGEKYGLQLPDRVINFELMAERQNYLIASSVLIVVGLILCFVPKSKREQEKETKQCPQCAEQVKREAKICRYCNHKFADEVISEKLATKIEESIKTEGVQLDDSEHSRNLIKLRDLIISEQKRFFGGYSEKVARMLENLCKTKDETLVLIYSYKKAFNTNLLDELTKLSNNTDNIKRNLEVFIDFDIVEGRYPFKRKNNEPI